MKLSNRSSFNLHFHSVPEFHFCFVYNRKVIARNQKCISGSKVLKCTAKEYTICRYNSGKSGCVHYQQSCFTPLSCQDIFHQGCQSVQWGINYYGILLKLEHLVTALKVSVYIKNIYELRIHLKPHTCITIQLTKSSQPGSSGQNGRVFYPLFFFQHTLNVFKRIFCHVNLIYFYAKFHTLGFILLLFYYDFILASQAKTLGRKYMYMYQYIPLFLQTAQVVLHVWQAENICHYTVESYYYVCNIIQTHNYI